MPGDIINVNVNVSYLRHAVSAGDVFDAVPGLGSYIEEASD